MTDPKDLPHPLVTKAIRSGAIIPGELIEAAIARSKQPIPEWTPPPKNAPYYPHDDVQWAKRTQWWSDKSLADYRESIVRCRESIEDFFVRPESTDAFMLIDRLKHVAMNHKAMGAAHQKLVQMEAEQLASERYALAQEDARAAGDDGEIPL